MEWRGRRGSSNIEDHRRVSGARAGGIGGVGVLVVVVVGALLGIKIGKPENVQRTFRYKPPAWMRFRTKYMQEVFETVCNTTFALSDAGKVVMPDAIKALKIKIGKDIGVDIERVKAIHAAVDGLLATDNKARCSGETGTQRTANPP